MINNSCIAYIFIIFELINIVVNLNINVMRIFVTKDNIEYINVSIMFFF